MNKDHNTPPKALINTWIELIKNKYSPEVRESAKNKLLNHFGTVQELQKYVSSNS